MESLAAKAKPDDKDCPHKRSLAIEDLNNNSLKDQECSQNYLANKGNKESHADKQGKHKDHDDKHSTSQNISREKVQMDEEKTDRPVCSKVKNCDRSGKKAAERDTLAARRNAEDSEQKQARPDSEDRKSSSDRGGLKNDSRSLSPECSQKESKILKVDSIKDDGCMATSWSSEAQNGKRPKEQKDSALKFNREPENKEHSKHKKAKIKHVETESTSEGPSLSFESYLNYDVSVLKRKVKSGGKPPKKTVGKEGTKESGMEAVSAKVAPCVASEKQVSLTMTQNIVAVHVSGRMSNKLMHFPLRLRSLSWN